MSVQKPEERIIQLAQKWLNGTITPEEKTEFDQWYDAFDDTVHETGSYEGEAGLRERIKNQIFSQANIPQLDKGPARRIPYWLGLAAALLLFAITGAYFLIRAKPAPAYYARALKQDLLPGGNKATLTLAGGHSIILNEASNGRIASEGSVAISKAGDGSVVYKNAGVNAAQKDKAVPLNTLSTPKGGQYHLTLADGTKVWLNAASSIKFPAVFQGSSREVAVTGEVYFEVAHKKDQPFRVTTNDQQIEVLGTHFDVNAYTDEPDTKTTLLEGKVKVISKNQKAILHPGQQARVGTADASAPIAVNTLRNAEEIIAWKKGFFEFDQASVASIMRQVARWYDVQVIYTGKTPDKTFSGTIARNATASQVLEILSYSGLHFKIEDKKIMVTP